MKNVKIISLIFYIGCGAAGNLIAKESLFQAYLAAVKSEVIGKNVDTAKFNQEWAKIFATSLGNGSIPDDEVAQIKTELCALYGSLREFEKAIALNDALVKLYGTDRPIGYSQAINGCELKWSRYLSSVQ